MTTRTDNIQQLTAALEKVAVPLFIVSLESGLIVYGNPQAENATGFSQSELNGMNFVSFFLDEDKVRVSKMIERSRDAMEGLEHYVRLRRKSKRVLTLNASCTLQILEGKEHLVFTFNDVTRLIDSQKKEEDARRYLENIIAHLQEVLFITDERGIILKVNEAGERTFGNAPGDLIGRQLSSVVGHEGFFNSKTFSEAGQSGSAVTLEVPVKDHTGLIRHFLFSLSSISEGATGVRQLVVVGSDTTEVMRQREEMTLNAKMASLGEMAAGISHEIANPLSVITAYGSQLPRLLESPKENELKVQRAISQIQKNCERAGKILQSLKSFSRNSGNDPFEQTRIADILQDARELCELKLMKHSVVKLTVNIGVEDLTAECQHMAIMQIVVNLINNSCDAIADLPEQWIKIEAADRGDFVELSVTDSGGGIPEEIRKQILTPFFTTKAPGKGTGLGLSISRRVVEYHNGTLEIDGNCPNTRFVITLPKQQSAAMQEAA